MLNRFRFSCSSSSFLLFSFLILLPLLFSCSPRLSQRKYNTFIDGSLEFRKNFTGFMLYEPGEEKTLYAYNSDKYFTPASNTKILTLYTALQVLGDSVPGIRYTISGDSLIFSGTGDPSFLNPALPSSKVYDFLQQSDKKLFYVKCADSLQALGPGWAWDDYNDNYSAEKAHFPLYGNIARFEMHLPKREISVVPALFSDSLVQREPEIFTASLVQRNVSNNRFTYHVTGEPSKTRKEVPFKWSPALAVALLSDTLHRQVQLLENYPKDLERILHSIPTDSLYKRMMQSSDNFVAEQILLLMSARMSSSFRSDSLIHCLNQMYLQDLPDAPVWVDGSGLSRYNLLTPRSLVHLWNKIYQEVPQDRLFSLLAVGGESGTIKNQFQGVDPFIFAKSGSLSNNYNLSGYLRAKSGKILIFSFMINNHVNKSDSIKQEIEKVLWEVHLHN